MALRPWMLLVRFVLELTAFAGFGYWAWHAAPGGWRWAAVVALPVVAMALWGAFAVPDDPSRSGRAPVPVGGPVRLCVEWAVFFGSVVAVAATGAWYAALTVGSAMVVYQALAYDRVVWLLRTNRAGDPSRAGEV